MEYKIINILKTRDINTKLTKSEESLLDYIEHNYKEISNMSVIKLCNKAYTSQATINRLCKKIGFKGFSEFKYALIEDIKKMESKNNDYLESINFYRENINFDEIENIIKVIKNNKKILIYGLGASKISATYFQRQLLYLGFSAIIISEEKMLELFDDFLLIIISSSGETLRITHLAKMYKEKKIISITKKESSLDKLSLYSFTHNIEIDKLNVIKREQQLHIIMMLNEIINRIYNR